jgi:hypothetical protein
LPNGLASPYGDYHRVSPARLVWAASTIGASPFGPRSHRTPVLELQWRAAMMRASIQQGAKGYFRSEGYVRLDPSEKGALSFFLGQAQAKVFAHDFFRVARFVHYDTYLAYCGRPRRKTRPDFIGFHGRQVAIGVEAKGRSRGFAPNLVAAAKRQARSLPVIAGHPTSATYVHVAYFDRDEWCAYLEDPPSASQGQLVDPATLTSVYYLPIVDAIRARQTELVSLVDDDVMYMRAYLVETDIYVAVRADIAELVSSNRPIAVGGDSAVLGKAAAVPLYELALSLDAESGDLRSQPEDGSPSFFVGGDGVAVELGSSWANWANADIR